MSEISLSDTTKGELLPYTGGVQFSYGANSPYPEGGQAPVPNATVSVPADGAEHLYRMDNTARLDFQREDTSYRELSFGGRFAATSDSPVGSLTIDHQSNELNKDIRTWPLLPDNVEKDTSNGRRMIAGALRHWYSECQLTEFGVKGDFLFATTNTLPNVAYYDHPTQRLYPIYRDDGFLLVHWLRNKPYVADRGTPFEIGDSVTFIVKTNNNYGKPSEGEVAPANTNWLAGFDLSSGKDDGAVLDGGSKQARLTFTYFYDTRVLEIRETDATNNAVNAFTINNNHTDMPGSPSYLVVKVVRESDTDLHYYLEFINRSGKTYADFVFSSDLIPTSVALTDVWGSVENVDPASPSLAFEGVQGLYVIKGDQYTIQEEDEWPIVVPWFNKPKWKDIVVPGMQGNAWSLIHDLCATYGLKFDPVFNNFSLYESLGMNQPWSTSEGSEVRVQASTRELAETVEVVNYKYKYTNTLGGYTTLFKADTVYSVALGEKVEHIVQLEDNTTFLSISQPECFSPKVVIEAYNDPDNPYSVYSVFDDDNLEVDRNSWIDGGGYVSVEATENLGEIKITIQAPSNDLISKESSFHISIAGSDIPGLVISGLGVKGTKNTITAKTGAGKTRNLKKLGTTYDNPLVCNIEVAWDVAAKLTSYYGSTQTTAQGVFPPSEAYDFPVLPILKHGSYFASTSISQNRNRVQVSDATRYNPVSWIEDRFKGLTCAEYKALWVDSVCRENNISPIRKAHF